MPGLTTLQQKFTLVCEGLRPFRPYTANWASALTVKLNLMCVGSST